jgi:Spy/CpxP family protein refolding chaperone
MRSHKLAVIATFLALSSAVGVAAAVADRSPSQPAQATDCSEQNGQQGVDEQGTANDIAAAAEEVDQEADNPQADDQAGDQQGPNDQSDEQGESNECGDDGDNGGDNGGD